MDTRSLDNGSYRDNGKEHGDYYSMLGLYGNNRDEHGNYFCIEKALGARLLGFKVQCALCF